MEKQSLKVNVTFLYNHDKGFYKNRIFYKKKLIHFFL